MASRYGGEYTPKQGWGRGETFRSYYAYRVARAERMGYSGGRQDNGRVIDAYRVQQEANKRAREAGRSAGIDPKRIDRAIRDRRHDNDPAGGSIRSQMLIAKWTKDDQRYDSLFADYSDEFGEPREDEFWYH